MSGPRPHIDAAVDFQIGRAILVARANLEAAVADPKFAAAARLRYQQGQAEYRYAYEWLDWPEVRFDGETYVEMLDSVIYPAMSEVVRERRRSFTVS